MNSNRGNSSRWLLKWINEAKKYYILASLLALLSSICFVFFSWYLSLYTATWISGNQTSPKILIIALLFIASRYLFGHFSSVINYHAGNLIVTKIKKKLYPKLIYNNKYDSISSTLMVSRVCDDLKPFFSFFIPYATASVMVGILLLFVSFWFEVWVGIILLLSFFVIPFQMVMIGVGAESLHKKHINLFMKYSAIFYNRIHTIAEIVNLNNQKTQYNFLSEKSNALNNATTNVMRVAILSSAILELFVSIAIAAVAIYLGMSLLGIMPGTNYGKGYDFHIALFLLMLTPYFFFYLRKFISAYHDRNKALASAKILIPLLSENNKEFETIENDELHTLQISNLNFTYPDSMVKALSNICITLPNCGLVLVKGISGSGKSTLLKILSGNLIIEEGSVMVNGNKNSWSSQWLLNNSSYMNQFPFIFDDSLLYNVFLDDKLHLNKECPFFLDKVINKKEKGWQTTLSHNGKQLSGGEKQLVTLARMLLHPKPIAILDEPTANLDHQTTDIILEQITDLSRNKLCIVASHEEKFETIATITINLNWGEQIEHD